MVLSAEQKLEKYILEHPDYWEFEDEAKEVATLKSLCKSKTIKLNTSRNQNYSQLELCG